MKDVVSRCPIEEAMRLLSGRWPTLLLYYLKDGTKRFSDLRRDNPTLSHRMLSLELRKLELARAMAARPLLLIADEAMAGLSSVEVDEILAILVRLNDEGITIIMIEHIMRAVMRFSSRIVVLDAGQTIADGTPEDILRHSAVEKAYLGT